MTGDAYMADAVSRVEEAKDVDNPMLGSKILGFFFPDFFPIWDTAWVKPALESGSESGGYESNASFWWEDVTPRQSRRGV